MGITVKFNDVKHEQTPARMLGVEFVSQVRSSMEHLIVRSEKIALDDFLFENRHL